MTSSPAQDHGLQRIAIFQHHTFLAYRRLSQYRVEQIQRWNGTSLTVTSSIWLRLWRWRTDVRDLMNRCMLMLQAAQVIPAVQQWNQSLGPLNVYFYRCRLSDGVCAVCLFVRLSVCLSVAVCLYVRASGHWTHTLMIDAHRRPQWPLLLVGIYRKQWLSTRSYTVLCQPTLPRVTHKRHWHHLYIPSLSRYHHHTPTSQPALFHHPLTRWSVVNIRYPDSFPTSPSGIPLSQSPSPPPLSCRETAHTVSGSAWGTTVSCERCSERLWSPVCKWNFHRRIYSPENASDGCQFCTVSSKTVVIVIVIVLGALARLALI